MQILGDAVNAVGKIDHAAIAKYIHKTEFTTVVGKVKFGPNGEWAKGRTLTVQWQNIKKKNGKASHSASADSANNNTKHHEPKDEHYPHTT